MYDEKDRLTKFIRVISSSLQALAKFIKVVSEEVNVQMDQYYRDLTAEKKFWKLGKHKSPKVVDYHMYRFNHALRINGGHF